MGTVPTVRCTSRHEIARDPITECNDALTERADLSVQFGPVCVARLRAEVEVAARLGFLCSERAAKRALMVRSALFTSTHHNAMPGFTCTHTVAA